MKMTSAYASKVLRKFNEDKEFWRGKEEEGCLYVAALDEQPVVPEYDYRQVSETIRQIDEKIVRIKHAINLANLTSTVRVEFEYEDTQPVEKEMTVDQLLIRMAQLSRRKIFLDGLRKRDPKVRINSGPYPSRKTAPEYRYINYDLDEVKEDYDRIDRELAAMQIALDRYNQTHEFEVEI